MCALLLKSEYVVPNFSLLNYFSDFSLTKKNLRIFQMSLFYCKKQLFSPS